MNEKGFVPIFYLIGLLALGATTLFLVATVRTEEKKLENKQKQQETANILPGPEITPTNIPTQNPSNKVTYQTPTPKATIKASSTTTPKSTPTTTSQSTSDTASCNYDLTSATGSVKISFQPQSGYLISSIRGELKATSGCKVLDGRSTDTLERVGSVSTKEVIFNSIPPGSYQVRYSFAGSWSGYQNISVSSGGLSTITANVTGDTPTPTPAPAFTPVCSGMSVYPSAQGSAPFTVQFSGWGSYSMNYSPAGYMWDFNGDGNWDTSASGNAISYTYVSPGSYTVKMKTVTGVWESSICQTTITVN